MNLENITLNEISWSQEDKDPIRRLSNGISWNRNADMHMSIAGSKGSEPLTATLQKSSMHWLCTNCGVSEQLPPMSLSCKAL